MSTNDPWERRERERERWRTKSARSAGTPAVLVPRFSSRVLWICSLIALHLIGDIPAVTQTLRTAALCLGFVGWVTFLGFNWPTASRPSTSSSPSTSAESCSCVPIDPAVCSQQGQPCINIDSYENGFYCGDLTGNGPAGVIAGAGHPTTPGVARDTVRAN